MTATTAATTDATTRVRRSVHLAPGHVGLDTRVFHKEARSLRDAGWDVTVVSLHDREEWRDGVHVIPLRRPRNRFERFCLMPFRLLRLALRHRADLYHVHDFEALPVGMVLALLGRHVVLDSHEDYPRVALDRPWIPRLLRRPLSSAVRVAERVATVPMDAIISAEDAAAARFPVGKTTVVRNYVLGREFPAVSEEARSGLVYVGDISVDRGARQMVEMAGRLHASHGVRLTLAGACSPRSLEDELRGLDGWHAVDFVGWQDRTGVQALLAGAEVAVVLLQPIRKYAEGAVPVKLLEYLAAGLPVVASRFPTIQAVVEPHACGALVDPTDVTAATAAVAALLDDPADARARGRRGAAAVRERYTWEGEASRLLALCDSVVPA